VSAWGVNQRPDLTVWAKKTCETAAFLQIYDFRYKLLEKRITAPETVVHNRAGSWVFNSPMKRPKSPLVVHKPAPLRTGSRIAIVAPAGCVRETELMAGIEAIRSQGFEPVWSDDVLARKAYLAGDERLRARDLLQAFRRDDVDGIFCARGGFGSMQLLPLLAQERKIPVKIFAGYSDITTLLNWFYQYRAMVAFHAPMVAMDLAKGISGRTHQQFWGTLTGAVESQWNLPLGRVIRPGVAEAPLMGGCLTLLAASLGTPYEIDTRGHILFLEDVGEKPYRLERLLTQLKLAGKFAALAGVVLGDFTDCDASGPRDIGAIVAEIFDGAPYPVVMGLAAGHGDENLTLPLGVAMRLDGDNARLALLESPVRQ